jgi:hypothetical protein
MSNFKIYPTIACNEQECEQIEINTDCLPMSAYEAMTNFQLQPRIDACMNILVNAAARKYNYHTEPVQNRNDDYLDPKKIGLFSKGLPHNSIGEVDLDAYASLENAIQNGAGHPELFDQIKTSGLLNGGGYRKLTNPQAGLAFDLEGFDSHYMTPPAAPSVYSQEAMDELLENYWMSATRDINFSDYATNPLTIAAAADLSSKTAFNGPRVNGQVTTGTLFRGNFEGDLIGPYISQFLYLDCPFGAATINQKIKTYLPNTNFMKDYATFLDIQNGKVPAEQQQFDPVLRYIRNGRDLSQWVHMDVLYQAYFNAMLILMTKASSGTQGAGINCPLDDNNPYKSPNPSSVNQDPFVTFGQPHLTTLLAEVAQKCMKATWYQKFFVQKRLRPEAMAGLVYNEINNLAQYGLNKNYLDSSYFDPSINTVTNGNPLLESAFPEGSPMHPSTDAGHASVAFACITVLKAWFKTDITFKELGITPMIPNPDGTSLIPYDGPDKDDITVLGELNKLASNISIGRNIASVHYRSDYLISANLGENFTLSVLNDQKYLYNENFSGFKIILLNGENVVV